MDDVEAIRRLKARYFRLMDTKDWAGMREVFTDDVVMDMTGAGGRLITGGDEFMSGLQEIPAGAATRHHGHKPETELTSASPAPGIGARHDMVIGPPGPRLDGYGHYHETYRKTDGEWRIASSTLTRLHTDFSTVETG